MTERSGILLSGTGGIRTIFLYTNGTEGRPPEALRQLARYMEHSTAENAKSEELTRLHKMVMEVKSDREVGLAYMKAYEAEKRIREKERAEGKAEGKIEDIVELLEEIGMVSENLEKRLWEQKDLEILRKWHKMAAHSGSIEEFERLISESTHETEEGTEIPFKVVRSGERDGEKEQGGHAL